MADDNPTKLLLLREELEALLANQIRSIVELGHQIVSSTIPDIVELVKIDNILRKVGNSHALTGCQQHVHQQAIQLQLSRFNDYVREFVMRRSTELLVIISNSKTVPIEQQASE